MHFNSHDFSLFFYVKSKLLLWNIQSWTLFKLRIIQMSKKEIFFPWNGRFFSEIFNPKLLSIKFMDHSKIQAKIFPMWNHRFFLEMSSSTLYRVLMMLHIRLSFRNLFGKMNVNASIVEIIFFVRTTTWNAMKFP